MRIYWYIPHFDTLTILAQSHSLGQTFVLDYREIIILVYFVVKEVDFHTLLFIISSMKCIVGLGNPGREYEYTRHNVGFMLVDGLRKVWGFEDWKESKFKWVIAEGMIGSEKIILLKPITYMNLSGESILSLIQFYKLDTTQDLLILSDDIDMEFAKVRFRQGGSHGGQKGLRSIIEKLANDTFSRIKIGIGRDDRYSVSDWVLSRFTKEELQKLESEVFWVVEEKINNWIAKK